MIRDKIFDGNYNIGINHKIIAIRKKPTSADVLLM
jgi:hypothetical protein